MAQVQRRGPRAPRVLVRPLWVRRVPRGGDHDPEVGECQLVVGQARGFVPEYYGHLAKFRV